MSAILSIARTTVGEAIRRRVLLVIVLIGLSLVVITPGLGILQARSARAATTALTLGIIQMTAGLIAVVLTVYMIPNEIERRTIYTILCKPVQRWQFLIGKYLGAIASLGMMMVLMTAVLILVTALQQSGQVNLAEIQSLVQAPFMFFWQMSLLAAIAMLFSTFVTPLVNFFLSSGVFIAGIVFSSLFQSFADSRTVNPLTKGLAQVVQAILPNFSLFNVQNNIVNRGAEITGQGVYILTSVGYALLYITVALAIACIVFDQREV